MNSLVIPAYNEEKRIRGTIKSLLKLKNFELIFVVDGDDRTADIVREFKESNKNIRLIKPVVRKGKWAAVILGFRNAKGEYVGFVDADLPVTLDDIKNGFRLIKSADIVIGSRTARGSVVKRTLLRKIYSRLFNLYIRILYGLPFGDTQCGFKVFKREVINKIIPRIRTRGWETDVELLHTALRMGFKVAELPVTWHEVSGSHLKVKSMLKMIFNLLKLRFSI